MAQRPDDKRIHPRAPIELKVDYKRVNSFLADYTKNISKGGTFIGTDKPLPIGTRFHFRISVPQFPEPINLTGEVAWIAPAGEKMSREWGFGSSISTGKRVGSFPRPGSSS